MISYFIIISTLMQTMISPLIQFLIKTLMPSSPAFGNTVPFNQEPHYQEIISTLKPGDIIFSRTNNSMYYTIRKFMGIEYDHVAVVLNAKEIIHISPPIISKLGIEHIINKERQPMIIRPKMEDMDIFMNVLHNFLGEKYNWTAIPKIMLNQLQIKLKIPENTQFSLNTLKYSKICSDSILYAISRGCPEWKDKIQQLIGENTKYKQIGYTLPDQIAQILLKMNGQILYRSETKIKYPYIDKGFNGIGNVLNESVFSSVLAKTVQMGKSPAVAQIMHVVKMINNSPLKKVIPVVVLVYKFYNIVATQRQIISIILFILMMMPNHPILMTIKEFAKL